MNSVINSFGNKLTKILNQEVNDLNQRLNHESHSISCSKVHEKERSENDQLAKINGKFWAKLV